MRTMLSLALLFSLVSVVGAQDTPEKKAGPSLKVGDPAPALKAGKWLQGSEVKEFASGQVYVVEFWATWCGPCIVMMPHMSDLQTEYKAKGVTFIGYSAKDPNNTQEKVEAFLEKRGSKLKYTFAYSDDRDTYNAWMKAAGRGGIPCSFVVDRNGKIAYIGHPMYLDVVLPKVTAGTWKIEEDKAALDKIEEKVNTVFKSFRGTDPEESLKVVAEFEKEHPDLAGIPYFTGPKLGLLLKGKDTEKATKFAEEVIAKALKQEDPLPLRTVSTTLRTAGKDNKELLGMSLKAAEAGLKLAGDKDAMALYYVAEAHFALGDKAKAKEFGAKAVEAAEDEPRLKTSLSNAVKKYEGEK